MLPLDAIAPRLSSYDESAASEDGGSRSESDGMSDEQVNLLLVDDRPENLLALEAILEPLGQSPGSRQLGCRKR